MVQDSKTNIPYRLLNPTNTSATAITSTKTTTMTKDSIILTDIQTEQRKIQIQYDAKLAKLHATTAKLEAALAWVEKDTKVAQKSISSLSLEVKAKYLAI